MRPCGPDLFFWERVLRDKRPHRKPLGRSVDQLVRELQLCSGIKRARCLRRTGSPLAPWRGPLSSLSLLAGARWGLPLSEPPKGGVRPLILHPTHVRTHTPNQTHTPGASRPTACGGARAGDGSGTSFQIARARARGARARSRRAGRAFRVAPTKAGLISALPRPPNPVWIS
jgi:hypothetical protein